jgi:hypothetical protein
MRGKLSQQRPQNPESSNETSGVRQLAQAQGRQNRRMPLANREIFGTSGRQSNIIMFLTRLDEFACQFDV